MIFPILKLLTHPAWIQFFQKLFFYQHLFLRIQMPVIFTILNAMDLYSRCAAHTQSNWKWHDFFPDRAIKGKHKKVLKDN